MVPIRWKWDWGVIVLIEYPLRKQFRRSKFSEIVNLAHCNLVPKVSFFIRLGTINKETKQEAIIRSEICNDVHIKAWQRFSDLGMITRARRYYSEKTKLLYHIQYKHVTKVVFSQGVGE